MARSFSSPRIASSSIRCCPFRASIGSIYQGNISTRYIETIRLSTRGPPSQGEQRADEAQRAAQGPEGRRAERVEERPERGADDGARAEREPVQALIATPHVLGRDVGDVGVADRG